MLGDAGAATWPTPGDGTSVGTFDGFAVGLTVGVCVG